MSASPAAGTLVLPAPPSVKPPPRKRTRTRNVVQNAALIPLCYLSTLPLEILAEVLSYTSSPQDILALARCSKYFCNTLVNNPATIFIWRHARARCQPTPIPDPTPNFTEASYAAFLFDSGICESCGKRTKEMYYSFSLRVRLCDKNKCIEDWRCNFILTKAMSSHKTEVNRTAHCLQLDDRASPYSDLKLWLPRLESTISTSVAHHHHVEGCLFVRKSDWVQAVDEYNRAMSSIETRAIYLREKRALAVRQSAVAEHAVELIRWRDLRKYIAGNLKRHNDTFARTLAIRHSWSVCELLATPSYGRMHWSKTIALECITGQDVEAIRSVMEAEIIEMRERRHRREAELAYKKRRDDVEQHYNRLKSAGEKQLLPTLPEFRKLSVIKVMQDRSSGAAGISKDLKNSKLIAELLKDNLEKWEESVRADLARVLGYPGWKAATKKKLHPVDRLTARFRCKKCHSDGQRQASLDFVAACKHTCRHLSKKRKAHERWSADKFEPDTRAIEIINQILILCGTEAEDPASVVVVEGLGSRIACLSCPTRMPMTLSMAIRHYRRHDNPHFDLFAPEGVEVAISAIYPIEGGLTSQLLMSADDAEKQRALKIYGCRHCRMMRLLAVVGGDSEQDVGLSAAQLVQRAVSRTPQSKMFNFNGLRSHLKEKHAISEIGDEDFYRQDITAGP